MIMSILKMCSIHKENFNGDALLSTWVFIWKKYPDRRTGSVSGIIYFCIYKKSAPSRQTTQMFITMC